jgi:hypothetical protein
MPVMLSRSRAAKSLCRVFAREVNKSFSENVGMISTLIYRAPTCADLGGVRGRCTVLKITHNFGDRKVLRVAITST